VLWTILDRTNKLGVVVYVVITVITKLVCRGVNDLVDATSKITLIVEGVVLVEMLCQVEGWLSDRRDI
jgi:hypothetical protein